MRNRLPFAVEYSSVSAGGSSVHANLRGLKSGSITLLDEEEAGEGADGGAAGGGAAGSMAVIRSSEPPRPPKIWGEGPRQLSKTIFENFATRN